MNLSVKLSEVAW